MTGILNSRPASLCFACLLTCAGSAGADDLILEGDARLTGVVRSISANGAVELQSPISPDPIFLKGSAVKRVVFSAPSEIPVRPTSRIELANGDILPVALESLDDKMLVVSSPEAGRLEIPREFLRSLHLGIYDQRVIYSGPDPLDNWIRDRTGSKNWSFEGGTLRAQGAGQISRKLEAAPQFIVRFTLHWQNNPNFQFSFADPLVATGKPSDRYYMQFTGAGLEIKRESSAGRRYETIVQLNRPPDQYAGSRLKVEIRVDRVRSTLKLYLNGELEGPFIDPYGKPPTGGGIALVSHAPNNTEQEISDIEVLEWDEAGDRHRTEDRGDPAQDSLIGRSAERWSGSLVGIRSEGGSPWFFFKSDFQDAPIEIPESEVSTVFFANQGVVDPPDEVHPFVLRLRGNGSLRVSSCIFEGDEVQAIHPQLGRLTLRRSGISALEHLAPSPEGTPKP